MLLVLDNFKELENQEPFWFITQVYDAIWHQCDMPDESNIYKLFFELTNELLDSKYHIHPNKNNKDRYKSSIIYWILMSARFLWKNKSDFNTIFYQLDNNPHLYRTHLFESWEEHYRKINKID